MTIIGNRNKIRESVTINRGTEALGETRIGDDCLLMEYCHVGHDSVIGNNVVMANMSTLGGHVILNDWVSPEGRGSVPVTDYQQTILGRQSNFGDTGLPIEIYEGQEGSYLESGFTQWGASGLAAVWAEENTRESIFSALRRKETFATSGNRISVRFFGGYRMDELDLNSENIISEAYRNGVPMGSDLVSKGSNAPNAQLLAPVVLATKA